jgi:hypothetical protein
MSVQPCRAKAAPCFLTPPETERFQNLFQGGREYIYRAGLTLGDRKITLERPLNLFHFLNRLQEKLKVQGIFLTRDAVDHVLSNTTDEFPALTLNVELDPSADLHAAESSLLSALDESLGIERVEQMERIYLCAGEVLYKEPIHTPPTPICSHGGRSARLLREGLFAIHGIPTSIKKREQSIGVQFIVHKIDATHSLNAVQIDLREALQGSKRIPLRAIDGYDLQEALWLRSEGKFTVNRDHIPQVRYGLRDYCQAVAKGFEAASDVEPFLFQAFIKEESNLDRYLSSCRFKDKEEEIHFLRAMEKVVARCKTEKEEPLHRALLAKIPVKEDEPEEKSPPPLEGWEETRLLAKTDPDAIPRFLKGLAQQHRIQGVSQMPFSIVGEYILQLDDKHLAALYQEMQSTLEASLTDPLERLSLYNQLMEVLLPKSQKVTSGISKMVELLELAPQSSVRTHSIALLAPHPDQLKSLDKEMAARFLKIIEPMSSSPIIRCRKTLTNWLEGSPKKKASPPSAPSSFSLKRLKSPECTYGDLESFLTHVENQKEMPDKHLIEGLDALEKFVQTQMDKGRLEIEDVKQLYLRMEALGKKKRWPTQFYECSIRLLTEIHGYSNPDPETDRESLEKMLNLVLTHLSKKNLKIKESECFLLEMCLFFISFPEGFPYFIRLFGSLKERFRNENTSFVPFTMRITTDEEILQQISQNKESDFLIRFMIETFHSILSTRPMKLCFLEDMLRQIERLGIHLIEARKHTKNDPFPQQLLDLVKRISTAGQKGESLVAIAKEMGELAVPVAEGFRHAILKCFGLSVTPNTSILLTKSIDELLIAAQVADPLANYQYVLVAKTKAKSKQDLEKVDRIATQLGILPRLERIHEGAGDFLETARLQNLQNRPQQALTSLEKACKPEDYDLRILYASQAHALLGNETQGSWLLSSYARRLLNKNLSESQLSEVKRLEDEIAAKDLSEGLEIAEASRERFNEQVSLYLKADAFLRQAQKTEDAGLKRAYFENAKGSLHICLTALNKS